MSTPPLGLILPEDRTPEQERAHEDAMNNLPRFFMPESAEPTGPVKIILTDTWRWPECVEDTGQEFTGFGQYTGSCVGVSEGNAITTVSCVQRRIANPTKAFICFWPFAYGRCRANGGSRGQGEGADDAVMGDTLVKEGWFDLTPPGLPTFKTGPDGFWLSGGKSVELLWSDGSRIEQKWRDLAKPNAGMTKAIIGNSNQIKTAIVNGYAVLDGCDNYVGTGHIKGEGANAYTVGKYTDRGGHSTCFLGYWDHPTDGPLFLYSNQWPTSTYPKDPAGGGRCTVWLPISEVDKLFRTGGSGGQTMALSNARGFPAQPKVQQVLSYFQ